MVVESQKNKESQSINGVSLFSGGGIGEIYLKKSGITIKVANELISRRAEFYKYLYPECDMVVGDIREGKIYNDILRKAIKYNCKFLIATPPCQGMSIAGKMREDDPRNSLIIRAVDFIKDLQPENVLIENVSQMFKTLIIQRGKLIKIKDFIDNELGNSYKISMNVLDAADYGTPQTRKRAIVLLSKKGWKLPPSQPKITVRQAIGYLPSLESGEVSNTKYHFAKVHHPKHILWMKHTPTGKTAFNNKTYYPKKDGRRIKGYPSTYIRMGWDKPAPTITMCNGAISSQNNVHPGRIQKDGTYSDSRVLSILELMILMGLPKNLNIPLFASDNLTRQIIGEGVPPKLIGNLTKIMPK